MPLAPGTRLGPYEIATPLGAGGMGEVYRARDTRLDRVVAIKILPSALAIDPQFRERFDREARALSGLEHPHICPLYDVGEHAGTAYLVMPMLDGESLADRLQKGPLPLDRALEIGVAIADALHRAHRAGIVHRDLKPANVMLTKSGAKLVDFGLAKSTEPILETNASLATMPRSLTTQGSILGTLQYMAPEQLEGREADARSDIFAFGALLHEMLTGRKAFEGKSQASLIAAILEREPPPISSLQPVSPPALDRVVRKCLAKDPDDRWQSAADLRDELRWIAAGAAAPGASVASTTPRRSVWPWVIPFAAGAALALASALLWRTFLAAPPAVGAAMAANIEFPADPQRNVVALPIDRFVVSPDGSRLVFVGLEPGARSRLWQRRLDSVTAEPIPGTDGAQNAFWSPDSQSLAFSTGDKLKRIDLSGGTVTIIGDQSTILPGAWGPDGVVLFNKTTGPLYRVDARGGTATEATHLDPNGSEVLHFSPAFLPDGRHFIYSSAVATNSARGVYVGSLDGGAAKLILPNASNASYVNGRLVYVRDATLYSQPFDLRKLELTREPTLIAEDIAIGVFRIAAVSVSPTVLAYRQSTNVDLSSQLTILDRHGAVVRTIGDPVDQIAIALSPDGGRLAASLLDQGHASRDIWIYDLNRGVKVRFTSEPSDEIHTLWSPDGRDIIYSAAPAGHLDLFRRAANGLGKVEAVFQGREYGTNKYPTSWSPDGKSLLYYNGIGGSATGTDIWLLPLAPGSKPEPFIQTQFNESQAVFSSDGRWVAYVSNESGTQEVYVVPADRSTGKTVVSSGGGIEPHWSVDGKELFYLNSTRKLFAVPIREVNGRFDVGAAEPLFDVHARSANYVGYWEGNHYQPFPDGQHFIVAMPRAGARSPVVTVIMNWTALEAHR